MRRLALVAAFVASMVLAVPAIASAWSLSVKPSTVRAGGKVRIAVTTRASCRFAVARGGKDVAEGRFKRGVRLRTRESQQPGKYLLVVKCAGKYEHASFKVVGGTAGHGHPKKPTPLPTPTPTPTPTPAPTPPPTPPPTPTPTPAPTPTGPVFPANPWTVTTYPMSSSAQGMIPGQVTCGPGADMSVSSPTITNPTPYGGYVYAQAGIYTRTAGSSSTLSLSTWSDGFFQGPLSGATVYLWQDIPTGQLAEQQTLWSWSVRAGNDAVIIQWVWDNGIWYASQSGVCTF